MSQPIEFYFDFSSPYGYLASTCIDALASRHGRSVNWRPVLLGAVFKVTGGVPVAGVPLKGDYARRDFARFARLLHVDYRHPSKFPVSAVAPTRAFYWLNDQDPARARDLAQALFRAYFVDDRDISDPAVVVQVAAGIGLDGDALGAALHEPAVKERARSETDRAVAAGVFGSPYMVVDGEPFWGADRLDQVEKWLTTGGW